MNIKQKFLQLTGKTYPHGTESGLLNQLPKGYKEDGHGNFYIEVGSNSTTMFTCHLDTADRKQEKVKHVIDGNIIKTNGETILGADDKAGMTVLLYMIEKNVPGLYYFFVGEERGCVGSSKLSKNWENTEFSNLITKCVSFDRRGTDSVITEQFYGVCCSDEFALELSKRLNAQDINFKYMPDPTGIYTDSAQFTSLIPECTNISVGYYNEHTSSERQDILHLERLCEAVCKIDWETLPIGVKESTYDYDDYDFDYPDFNSNSDLEWSYENYSYFSTESGTSSKMFIAKTQIDSEKEIISNWIKIQGFCPGFKSVVWNGNSLYIESESGQYDYLGERIELCDMIPELQEVQEIFVKESID
jgi:hypothetical protein